MLLPTIKPLNLGDVSTIAAFARGFRTCSYASTYECVFGILEDSVETHAFFVKFYSRMFQANRPAMTTTPRTTKSVGCSHMTANM